MRLLLLLVVISLSCWACNDETNTNRTPDTETTTTTDTDTKTSSVRIADFGATKNYPDARMVNMLYKDGRFNYTIENYELGAQTPDADQLMCANSDKGQHIHLIIDNEPYIAQYEAAFDHDLTDGKHHILSFLSRSYHESIKTDAAHRAEMVEAKGGNITAQEALTQPMLFYSRPKGTYVGKDTKKLLLDFYPVNLTLGSDYGVKVEVNGEAVATVNEWKPYALEGLPMGDNKVTLTLVDGQGNTVDAPLNPVTRTITLKPDPAEGVQG